MFEKHQKSNDLDAIALNRFQAKLTKA